jgi:hypothetical protein
MTEVKNLTKTEGERGCLLRFIGGVLHGDHCFVPHTDNTLEAGMLPTPAFGTLVQGGEGRVTVGPFSFHDTEGSLRSLQSLAREPTSYRRLRVRLATPSAVLDEVVMADKALADAQAKQLLADVVGLKLPKLHMFNVKRSDMISYIAWDSDALVMDVGMKNGHSYRFFDRPAIEVMEFLAADSLGSHYNKVYRNAPCVRLDSFRTVLG